MAWLADVVVDAVHPASLARFWAAVLDGYEVAPYDEAERARLREIGVTDPEDDPTVLVEPSVGAVGPRWWFQRVPEGKVAKNRMHVDLRCADFQSEVDRLVMLGAVLADRQGSAHWLTFTDPEGNEFCLLR